jgi:hypothetical protein
MDIPPFFASIFCQMRGNHRLVVAIRRISGFWLQVSQEFAALCALCVRPYLACVGVGVLGSGTWNLCVPNPISRPAPVLPPHSPGRQRHEISATLRKMRQWIKMRMCSECARLFDTRILPG